MAAVIIASLFSKYALFPVIWRRHFRKYKLAHEEFTLELFDDGLTISSPSGHTKLAWDKILKWRQNERYVLVYTMPRLAHIIPKSIQASHFDISAVTEQLTRHIGRPA